MEGINEKECKANGKQKHAIFSTAERRESKEKTSKITIHPSIFPKEGSRFYRMEKNLYQMHNYSFKNITENKKE